jgi:hypothetical protein
VANKKIKGAVSVEFNNIKFKSRLEKACYQRLLNSGLTFFYEPERIVIFPGRRLGRATYFQPDSRNKKKVGAAIKPLLPITYTPDFLVVVDNNWCYFDVKGYANDRYPLKKKMFLSYLDEIVNKNCYFFEVHSVAQIDHTIQIIKEMRITDRIKALIPELPEKDQKLADKFFLARDFRSLWEIAHSCIILAQKSKDKESKKGAIYKDLDLDKLQTLETEVSNYLTILEPDWRDNEPEPEEDDVADEEY